MDVDMLWQIWDAVMCSFSSFSLGTYGCHFVDVWLLNQRQQTQPGHARPVAFILATLPTLCMSRQCTAVIFGQFTTVWVFKSLNPVHVELMMWMRKGPKESWFLFCSWISLDRGEMCGTFSLLHVVRKALLQTFLVLLAWQWSEFGVACGNNPKNVVNHS